MSAARDEAATDFATRFADFWSAPAPDRLGMLLADDVLLVAPMLPTTRTLEDGKRVFADLFAQIPDLTGEVHRWGSTRDGALIEFTLSGHAGGGPISWDAVDRIVLGADGLATARISYFDPTPILLTALRRPRSWPGFARSRLGRIRR
jgi:hypothetical protein